MSPPAIVSKEIPDIEVRHFEIIQLVVNFRSDFLCAEILELHNL